MLDSLYFLFDTSTNGYNVEFLNIISFIAILCGILVIISKNPIISVLFLIGLFLCISSYLILLGISFIGLSYLLVYVGAVSILFLFILMLINVRVSELQAETNNSLPLAIIIGVCFYAILSEILPFKNTMINYNELVSNILNLHNNNIKLVYVTSNFWDGSLAESSHITTIGNIIYTNYFLWLIMTSIILLLAMVGAIIITIRPSSN
jgi:NADH-ubiquinone oxidoreductase chain 6